MGSFDSWIEWFLAQRGNNFLCEVDASFVQDSFNLYGLQAQFEDFSDTIDLILSQSPRSDREGLAHPLYADARVLYGLIHARFILTSKGLTLMLQEFEEQTFGVCPRYFCHNASCLPVGISNASDASLVKLFCPRCEELYSLPDDHPSSTLDGAFFGPTFAHVLLLVNPHFLLGKTSEAYRPKIYGFAVMNQPGRSDLLSEASLRFVAAPSHAGSTLTGYEGDRETVAGGVISAFSGASAGLSVGVGAGAGAGAGAGSRAGGNLDGVHGGRVDAIPISARAESSTGRQSHRTGPLTTFYDGARPEEDDFFSSDDEPQPRGKRPRV